MRKKMRFMTEREGLSRRTNFRDVEIVAVVCRLHINGLECWWGECLMVSGVREQMCEDKN